MAYDDGEGLYILALVIAGFVLVPWAWNSKLRFKVQYGLDSSVSIAHEPTDCDFMSAPMGSKDCKYEKSVFVAMYAPDIKTGRAVVSWDEGKTWQWNDGGPAERKTLVYVSWHKVVPQ